MNGYGDYISREQWLDKEVRAIRNIEINRIDLVEANAERWDAMTIAQRDEVRRRKQALRDLTATIEYESTLPIERMRELCGYR